ncbi:hypothetical protein MTR67_051248 [Solanum verrucosum]|uniref:Uncharacterized protein n=1 Tax=Solanum verrucosum TaxID=315347 RepID=A0AAF0V2X9_SOLVR|nr:hypothetical protein MTR67_051248 [Solanum verrucosum]
MQSTIMCQSHSSVKTFGLADRPCVEVEVRVDEKRSSKWNSGAKHEVGYDAFMTGCIFAQACNHLGIDFTLHVLARDLAKETKLQNYINRLYLSWFTKPELVSKFLEMKETLSRISDPISMLHPLPNILNGEYTHHAATYDVYQQICSPSTSKKLFANQAEAVGIKHKTVSSRAKGEKKGNQVFDKENEVRMFDEKVDDQMSPSHGYSETDRSTESFYLDEVLASK